MKHLLRRSWKCSSRNGGRCDRFSARESKVPDLKVLKVAMEGLPYLRYLTLSVPRRESSTQVIGQCILFIGLNDPLII